VIKPIPARALLLSVGLTALFGLSHPAEAPCKSKVRSRSATAP
jgi:hypothetical protein